MQTENDKISYGDTTSGIGNTAEVQGYIKDI